MTDAANAALATKAESGVLNVWSAAHMAASETTGRQSWEERYGGVGARDELAPAKSVVGEGVVDVTVCTARCDSKRDRDGMCELFLSQCLVPALRGAGERLEGACRTELHRTAEARGQLGAGEGCVGPELLSKAGHYANPGERPDGQ